jgi:hypothetical protein
MAFSKQPDAMETRFAYWRRVLRPLLWWCLLVLVLYGIRLHQRWNAQTHLRFSANVPGQNTFADTYAEMDGRPYYSGQQLNIGRHKLVVTQQNGYPFTTNMFVWYGPHDLGNIILERTKGTLVVSCSPSAARLIIRGAEFSTTLTNSSGFNSRVPTGNYKVEALYDHWRNADTASITTDGMASKSFTPRFGSVVVAGSHPDIRFELRDLNGELMAAGQVPMLISGLPEVSQYKLTSERKDDQKTQMVAVRYGTTNDVQVEFTYGVVTIESKPVGAKIYRSKKEIGITPLTLNEVRAGSFEFSLAQNEYEPVTASIFVMAQQTNYFSTNLVSIYYTRAMSSAQQAFANQDFGRSMDLATEALTYNPGNIAATNLLLAATFRDHQTKAANLAARGDFAGAITEANLALVMEPENAATKTFLAEYTAKENQRLEAERVQREREAAVQLTQQRTRELKEDFNSACASYENATTFDSHEYVASNSVTVIGKKISEGLSAARPALRDVNLAFVRPHLFKVTARQAMWIGYRDVLIYGSQVRETEVQLRFKVFEYEHPPQINLLGGMVQLNTTVGVTSQDPQTTVEQARQFQKRVRDGVKLVQNIIQQADQP